MWKLTTVNESKVLRDGASTPWELLISCFHLDGRRFKKAECDNIHSGLVVYKHQGVTQMVDRSNVTYEGELGHSGKFMVKAYGEKAVACILTEY